MNTNNISISKLDKIISEISVDEIDKIIAAASAKASAVAVLPIPIIDIAGVTFIQLNMVSQLAKKYGINQGDKSKIVISSIAASLIGKLITSATEQLAVKSKVDRLLGETLIKATIAGFVTSVTGEIYANHFRNGGSFENISLHGTMDYFKSQLNSDRLSVENVTEVAVSALTDKLSI